MFFALQKPATPVWAKTMIIGALGYFILPVDIIPDIIPIAGYTDDLTALVAAIVSVTFYIDEDVKQKSKAKLHDWFKAYDESELNEVDNKIKK